jgi:ankyrin repeat protein
MTVDLFWSYRLALWDEAYRFLFADVDAADKSIKDADGKTAYDHAIENGHTELAELL